MSSNACVYPNEFVYFVSEFYSRKNLRPRALIVPCDHDYRVLRGPMNCVELERPGRPLDSDIFAVVHEKDSKSELLWSLKVLLEMENGER